MSIPKQLLYAPSRSAFIPPLREEEITILTTKLILVVASIVTTALRATVAVHLVSVVIITHIVHLLSSFLSIPMPPIHLIPLQSPRYIYSYSHTPTPILSQSIPTPTPRYIYPYPSPGLKFQEVMNKIEALGSCTLRGSDLHRSVNWGFAPCLYLLIGELPP